MIAKEMYSFREALAKQGVIFCYSGYMTEEVLAGIGKTLRSKLDMEKTDRKVARGIFSLFVEQVQNVIRYSAEKEPDTDDPDYDGKEMRYGLLTVGQNDDRHFVACANLVPKWDVDRLRENLTKIQNLDKEELKALYKQILKGDVPVGSKGAGVGFVDIARRATHGFDFDFIEIDAEYSYFALKAYI
ncbi:MAG: hypothetical protein HQL72_05845 [Magnetococcales bacterium]|nr:hypothetical protein [Magnetococcales bacterium]